MHAILLPDDNLLIPVDPDAGFGLAEIGPEHPEYGRWMALVEESNCRTENGRVPPRSW